MRGLGFRIARFGGLEFRSQVCAAYAVEGVMQGFTNFHGFRLRKAFHIMLRDGTGVGRCRQGALQHLS